MRTELKVTLSPAEVQKYLVDVVAKKQRLDDGEYKCACTTASDGEIVLVFSLVEKVP